MDPDEIKSIILAHIGEAEVEIVNPSGDGLHFEALVVSPKFNGLSLIQQHQMVMEPLKGAFETRLHALKLTTRGKETR